MKWTIHIDGGPARVNHAAVPIGKYIYMFGGYHAGENFEEVKPMDVYVFNTDTLKWYQVAFIKGENGLGNVPYLRYGHTAVAYKNCAYIWGGRNDILRASSVLHCYDPYDNKWCRPEVKGRIPGKRDGHSACVVRDCMYIFGGYVEEVDQFDNTFSKLDFRTFQWSTVRALGEEPEWRDFQTTTAIGDKIYTYGGRGDEAGEHHTSYEKYDTGVWIFDTISSEWKPVPHEEHEVCPRGRRSHFAWTANGKLYIHAGYNGLLDLHFNDVWMYDPAEHRWEHLQSTHFAPRRRGACCVVASKVYFFGGTTPRAEGSGAAQEWLDHANPLQDLGDLYVLDYAPSLRSLTMMKILKDKIPYLQCNLPADIRRDLDAASSTSCLVKERKETTCSKG